MDHDTLDAGDYGAWLDGMEQVLGGGQDADVACGECTACCTASQFVHIGPDETETIARIPRELLFPAPLLPRGQLVLGYDELGRCPMLGDRGCSIYEHRPRTCRSYDCRVFTATAVEPDDDLIEARARRWRFRHATPTDALRADATRAAAARLTRLGEVLDDGTVPSSPTQLAVLAVEMHGYFLDRDPVSGEPCGASPSDEDLLAAVERWSPVS